ncbi:hypothetical protein [Microbacterium sp. Leaf320]|uniref:hypothetical protein n=1 Tax=Microbacterium sp. Leaf320 TaxID=1736334 RepID=UPI0012F85250|nr:hypothetical protein [Microbacterium sp. Leaf320]
MRAELSETGQASFQAHVSASSRECLASTALTTACGLDVSSYGQDADDRADETVVPTLTAGSEFALASVSGERGTNSVVSAYTYIDIDIVLEGPNAAGDRRSFAVLSGARLRTPSADFAAETPAVVWELP